MVYLMFAAGLVGLIGGGELLIRGSVAVAQRLMVPPLVIGLTIIGFGTSTPELLVSIQAALAEAPAIAIGNVVGSNIANVLLILGTSALFVVVPMPLAPMRRDFAVMFAAMFVLWAMLFTGSISRIFGAILVVGLALYLWQALTATRTPGPKEPDIDPALAAALVAPPLWKSLPAVIAGLVILMVGARLLVDSATEIARTFGVSEAVIGLTIVAVGTSLPELSTSILAALRRQPELAVGNILGSNVFNILCILGVTALVSPIPADPRFARLDMVFAFGAALAMLAFAGLRGKIGRLGGAGLLASYVGYLALVAQP
ncbi:MAG: calcium/sodium antiporter [Albidovulum sp.]